MSPSRAVMESGVSTISLRDYNLVEIAPGGISIAIPRDCDSTRARTYIDPIAFPRYPLAILSFPFSCTLIGRLSSSN